MELVHDDLFIQEDVYFASYRGTQHATKPSLRNTGEHAECRTFRQEQSLV